MCAVIGIKAGPWLGGFQRANVRFQWSSLDGNSRPV